MPDLEGSPNMALIGRTDLTINVHIYIFWWKLQDTRELKNIHDGENYKKEVHRT